MKKRIRICVAEDCGTSFDLADRVLDWIADRYDIEMVPRDAGYVIYSCYGYQVLKHPEVRIFLTGENVLPDFNLCDYATGYQYLDFGDRYYRLPLYRFYTSTYQRLLQPRRPVADMLADKSGFCAFVASNSAGDSARRRIVELLNAYQPVAMGGRWMNNVGGPVPDKLAFQSHYKFAIAFENSSTPGYLCEKITDAFASDAIPIYWGDPEVARDFNPDAFVNCHACGSLEAAVARVRQIDQDDALYRRMLAAPSFREGREPEYLREDRIRAFLFNIFDQPWEQAFRRNRGRWGRKYERRLGEAFHRPHLQAVRYVQRFIRHLRRRQCPYPWTPPGGAVSAPRGPDPDRVPPRP